MNPCRACQELNGKPSSSHPHPDLAEAGAGVIGSPGNFTKLNNQYNCTVCGTWMYQNTADGDPPNEWRIGDRPEAWPEG
jgi:hypothetical protein